MAESSVLTVLAAYVGFDADGADRLQALSGRMEPYREQIVDRFYQAILEDPGARAVLKNEAQIQRLRASLLRWLEGLFAGPYDAAYCEKRSRIGRIHVKVGLEQRYMLGAMNLIRSELHRAVSDSAPDDVGLFEDHNVIDQICDIELAIMLETYREDYVLKKTAEAESLAVMGRLTAGLAHEVRNPLNAAKLQLDVLQRTASKVEDASTRRKIERRTNVVQDELRRLSFLLDDFLNLARAQRMEPIRCNARTLLEEVLELRRPEIESQGIEFIENLHSESSTLLAERDRLKQVVNNLITNAVEAVASSRQPSIQIVSRMLSDNRWEVTVIDNGPGVQSEVLGRAFESFVTTKDAGTGLGLAIVKRIVDLHGGNANLVSLPDGGTRASFWIPRGA
ncbi:MAG: GHKL domain-containing protein [Deltaproteobacteria bacterium]|nr:GHKL domain-containing protein [Deltaproteobacteria bacterium]NND30024.1 GHKL domain-containing protein [Myxococcales bacterium]MBT8466392.1 GHKL domain-containing protein [Deltaproteobacteria bacterium]MBT8480844.1 GHKL domain-containing protein [Deltaproteobacteria bacterium]NNK08135.1 GHKL domain-containing protein [Myxococcales bacterium]